MMNFQQHVDLVIYHKDCSDGFASAYAAWKLIGNKNVEYHPSKHGDNPPDVSGKTVAICDFSYSFEVLSDMIRKAKNLIVLDHHKSAMHALEKIPDENKLFQMDRSGAVITWKYFHPNTPVPKFILYIEDRDIWANKLPNTKEFSAAFVSVPKEFQEYDRYLDENNIDLIIKKGGEILENNKLVVKDISSKAVCRMQDLKGNIYMIASVESSILISDIGNYLVSYEFPNCDFAAIFNYDIMADITYVSLRSSDRQVDVCKIASLFGGGGHRNASGFTFPGRRLSFSE